MLLLSKKHKIYGLNLRSGKKVINMVLTREFKETIEKRAADDPEFRYALLLEAINELLTGDLAVAKLLLRDYVNASPKFEILAKKMGKNSKSIQRMLGPHGNPTAENLTGLIKAVQKIEKIKFQAKIQ